MIFARTPKKAAFYFSALMWLYLMQVLCLVVAHWMPLVILLFVPVAVLLVLTAGLLAYQIGWHPILALLGAIAFCLPLVNVVFLLLLIAKAKPYLEINDYEIVLMGARHVPRPEQPNQFPRRTPPTASAPSWPRE